MSAPTLCPVHSSEMDGRWGPSLCPQQMSLLAASPAQGPLVPLSTLQGSTQPAGIPYPTGIWESVKLWCARDGIRHGGKKTHGDTWNGSRNGSRNGITHHSAGARVGWSGSPGELSPMAVGCLCPHVPTSPPIAGSSPGPRLLSWGGVPGESHGNSYTKCQQNQPKNDFLMKSPGRQKELRPDLPAIKQALNFLQRRLKQS